MTLENAIKMLQNLRNYELHTIKIFDGSESIQKNMQIISKAKADHLEKILHELEPQTYPCNHPKIWHDVSDEQLYCMGCNQNL